MTTAQVLRATVAAALVAGAAMTITSILLMPDFSGGHAERLQAIAANPGTAPVSAVLWTLSQLPVVVGLLGVAQLARHRAPILAGIGGVLVLLGAFGHAIYGGVQWVMLSMAEDLAAVETHAQVLARMEEQGLALPVMAAGLLGTVAGYALLGVALWRGRTGPRWIGPALIVWVLLEFVGSGFSHWMGYASGLLYGVIFVALAVTVWRSGVAYWRSQAETAALIETAEPAVVESERLSGV